MIMKENDHSTVAQLNGAQPGGGVEYSLIREGWSRKGGRGIAVHNAEMYLMTSKA